MLQYIAGIGDIIALTPESIGIKKMKDPEERIMGVVISEKMIAKSGRYFIYVKWFLEKNTTTVEFLKDLEVVSKVKY